MSSSLTKATRSKVSARSGISCPIYYQYSMDNSSLFSRSDGSEENRHAK